MRMIRFARAEKPTIYEALFLIHHQIRRSLHLLHMAYKTYSHPIAKVLKRKYLQKKFIGIPNRAVNLSK